MGTKYGSSRSTIAWNQTGLLALQASLLSQQSKAWGPSFLSTGSITFRMVTPWQCLDIETSVSPS